MVTFDEPMRHFDDEGYAIPVSLYSDAVTADAGEMMVKTEATETVVNEETGAWEGILAVEGIETGDQRKFAAGSLKWADPPIPLMWAPANMGAHQGAVMAGRINEIWRDPANPAMIRGRGTFDLSGEHGAEAFRQVKEGFLKGVSIDPDQIGEADIEMQYMPVADGETALDNVMKQPSLTVFHAGRIRAATLVQIPAFVEAQIALASTPEGAAVTAAVVYDMNSILTGEWSAIDNDMRLPPVLSLSQAKSAFAYVLSDRKDTVSKTNCRFLHHVIDENGNAGPANLAACEIAMNVICSNRGKKLHRKTLKEAYNHLAEHLNEAGITPPAFAIDDTAEDLVACGGPDAPPSDWFENPRLDHPTPFTVTDEGQVFGHAALWGSCHTSFADSCVQPPYEEDYGFFTTGEVVCADGTRVAAGQITLGTSHADTRGITAMQAVDHYGNTGTAVADVTAGSDDHGIWIAGSLRPSATSSAIRSLRAAALSGDWRRLGGNLRMVALLAVNVPGFPIPRTTTTIANNRQLTLVAAGMVTPEILEATALQSQIDALKTRVHTVTAVNMLRDRILNDVKE